MQHCAAHLHTPQLSPISLYETILNPFQSIVLKIMTWTTEYDETGIKITIDIYLICLLCFEFPGHTWILLSLLATFLKKEIQNSHIITGLQGLQTPEVYLILHE